MQVSGNLQDEPKASANHAMVREAALALIVTLIVAIGPFTPNEWGPSLALGALVGAAVFAIRVRWFGALEPAAAGDEARPLASIGTWAAGAIGFGALCVAFLPTFQWLYYEWTRSVWANDHGLFMPFLIGYLGVHALGRDRGEDAESSAWGLPLLGFGLVLSVADAVIGTRYLGLLGFLLALPALSLLLLGARRTRILAAPLALTLLMVPIPYTLSTHLYLRHVTAALVEPILRGMGYRLVREATVIHMNSGDFVVSDACSGIATLYASIAFACVMASMTRSVRMRWTLILIAPFLALFANVIRVTALILMSDTFGSWILETPLHEGTGVVAFVIVLFGLVAITRGEIFGPKPKPRPA